MGLMDVIRSAHNGETVKTHLEVFVGKLAKSPSNRSAGWHPSEFCDMCPRQRVLVKRDGIKEKPFKVTPRLQRVFDVGSAMHAWYHDKYLGPAGVLWGRWKCSRCHRMEWGFMPRDKCECTYQTSIWADAGCDAICGDEHKEGYEKRQEKRGGCIHCGVWGGWVYEEVPVQKTFLVDIGHTDPREHIITGHCDGLVTMTPWSMKGPWVSLEIKSMHDRSFGFLKDAEEKHRKQALIYNRLIQLKHVPGLPQGVELPYPEKPVVLYLGKNTSEEKEFPIQASQKEADDLIDNPRQVEQALADDELPERHGECHSDFADRAKKCVAAEPCFAEETTP